MDPEALLRSYTNLEAWRRVPEEAVREYKEKYAADVKAAWEKDSNATRKFFESINLLPGNYPGGIPNNPSPLKSMLVGGLAGAGLGYGLGWAGEKILPDKWKRDRLRWTLAMLGGAAGAAPGLAWGGFNMLGGHKFDDSTPGRGIDLKTYPDGAAIAERYGWGKRAEFLPDLERVKAAFDNNTGLGFSAVPVDSFNRVIWGDPRVANRLSPQTRAAATGLITSAANLPGKLQTQFVTPFDVARIAAGMGSGYLSGALVGKGLGLLMGMPESTQERLKNTGMFAGVVANLVPMAFGA